MASQERVAIESFADAQAARMAVDDLIEAGFNKDDIGMAGPGAESDVRNIEEQTEEETKAGKGAAIGVATGAGVGTLWALGIVAGILPAIGPVIAGGALASILASAATGAAAAGVVGALVGYGMPEDDAQRYEEDLKRGRTLVAVKTQGDEYGKAMSILQRYRSREAEHAADYGQAAEMQQTAEFQLAEEKVEIAKERVPTGEVQISKEVVTEYQALEVPVEREEVIIERRPASPGEPAIASRLQPGEEIRVPLSREEVHVEKEVVPSETVRVGKRIVEETQPVSEEVRKEKLRVDREGEARVRSDTSQESAQPRH